VNVYDRGDTVRFVAKFSKVEVFSAPSVTLTLGKPGGATESVAVEEAHTATEWRYLADYFLTTTAPLGSWKYRFTSTGSAAQVESSEFLVRAPLV